MTQVISEIQIIEEVNLDKHLPCECEAGKGKCPYCTDKVKYRVTTLCCGRAGVFCEPCTRAIKDIDITCPDWRCVKCNTIWHAPSKWVRVVKI